MKLYWTTGTTLHLTYNEPRIRTFSNVFKRIRIKTKREQAWTENKCGRRTKRGRRISGRGPAARNLKKMGISVDGEQA